MGHKTHPIGFRLGIVKSWQARWFEGRGINYQRTLFEDLRIRNAILQRYSGAGISQVEIERSAQEVGVQIWTARPGIVIGRQGQRIEELRQSLEALTERKIRVWVQEIERPEIEATLVARNIAEQLERRVAFRRAIQQTASRTMQAGAQGIKVIISGRLGGAEIARSEKAMMGRVPLHTLRADIDYSSAEAHTQMGRIGVKVWIYKGEILPEGVGGEGFEDEIAPIQVTVHAGESEDTDVTTETA